MIKLSASAAQNFISSTLNERFYVLNVFSAQNKVMPNLSLF